MKATVADPVRRAGHLLARHAPSLLRGRRLVDAAVPATGKNSEIYILAFDDGTRAVLRAMRPASLCGDAAAALRFAKANGAPVPGVLAATGPIRRLLHRAEGAVVEQFVEGVLWRDAGFAFETNLAVVRAVADLHNVVRDRMGMLRRPRGGSPHDALLRSTLAIAGELDPAAIGCDPGELAAWARAARRLHAAMPRAETCSLVHKHLGKSDAMIARNGRAALLDCVNLAFDHFGGDLADVLETVRRNGGGDRIDTLATAYFARRRGLPDGIGWGDFGPFLLLNHHLKRLRATLRKSSADRATQLAASISALRELAGGD